MNLLTSFKAASLPTSDSTVLALDDITESLKTLAIASTEHDDSSAATDDPLDFIRGNVTADLHHYVDLDSGIRNDVDKFLANVKQQARPTEKRITDTNSR